MEKTEQTLKHTVRSLPSTLIVFLGRTLSGHHHDDKLLKQEFPPEMDWLSDLHVRVAVGYQGMPSDDHLAQLDMPYKKPRKRPKNPQAAWSAAQQAVQKALSQIRIFVEHAIGGMKRSNILVHSFRNRTEHFEDDAIGVCAGLWNLVLSYWGTTLITSVMPSSSNIPATRPRWSKIWVRYGCGLGEMAGRYDGRIVSSFAGEIVSTPQNYSITHEWCGMPVRHNLGEILDQVANTRARFLIKRSGIPAAVILSVSDYEDLEDLIDTYYEQQDEIFQQSLNHAREEITSGKAVTLDDLRRDLEVKERKEARARRTSQRS